MDNIALQFSGGRDSLALLLYMEPHWDKLTVYHTSTGDDFPETLALVDKVKETVPHFKLIQGNSLKVREEFGPPSDLLLCGGDWPRPEAHFKDYVLMQDRYLCCYRSLMKPMHDQMVKDNINVILRGQRDSDVHKNMYKHGAIVGGVTLLYPIREWGDRQVEDFIVEQGWEVPPFYKEGCEDTPNCKTCTAWLEFGGQQYVRRHYPESYEKVRETIQFLYSFLHPSYIRIRKIGDVSGF